MLSSKLKGILTVLLAQEMGTVTSCSVSGELTVLIPRVSSNSSYHQLLRNRRFIFWLQAFLGQKETTEEVLYSKFVINAVGFDVKF